jgi:integration host factor subunit alpha
MPNGSITRADFTAALKREVGLSRSDCTIALEGVLDEIAGCLAMGETFKMHGFATFTVRHKKARMGRNPRTGEEAPILPRKVVTFHPSENLKLRINQPDGR